MNKRNLVLSCATLSLIAITACVEQPTERYVTSCAFPADATTVQKVRMAAHVVPSKRQLDWQKMEYTCFICYGINTFTDREWGTGKEDPKLFDPSALDTDQWVKTAKDAGMKMILLTCKHHDGFCLWPSKETDFSVAASPWKGGKGDLVKDVAESCKKQGLKFAVYLSPWDMNHPDYGTEKYNDVFVNQLTELLTQYGTVDEVWFDGACGEGPNGKKQVYDFERYYSVIRKLQPNAVIAVMGPDVRWVGTESGYGRDTEWSVIPASAANLKQIANTSQQELGTGTFLPEGDKMAKDLGSSALLEKANGVMWYPSEVDVSIRPGWYYHAAQDTLVKTPQKLIDIYYSSIGKNSLLLLNLPPDKRGVIHENDVHSLMEMERILDKTFETNFFNTPQTNIASDIAVSDLTDETLETYWSGTDNSNELAFTLANEATVDRLMIQENITEGQRIESFVFEYWNGSSWVEAAKGTTVGFKRLLRFAPVTSNRFRIVVLESRDTPQISEFGIFKASKEE